MREFFRRHKKTRWTLISLGVLLLILVVVVTFFDWNLARGPIARMITAKTGRSASIDGNLRVHLWSMTPTVDVEKLRLGNPNWAKKPLMFGADRIDVSVSLGRLLRGQIVIPKLEVISPQVDLERDAQGRASWEFTDSKGTPPPTNGKPTQLPTIRLLVIRDGKINVTDQIKKLALSGTLAQLFGAARITVNSLHEQAIDRLGEGLVAEAIADDGTIEAVRVEGAPGFAYGVQWHPEWEAWQSPVGTALFEAFGAACRAFVGSREQVAARPRHARASVA